MESIGVGREEIRIALRIVAIVAGGMLMVLPAYINQTLFGRLRISVPVSLAISLQLFVLGVLLFIAAIGPARLERLARAE
ncbi:hypothetical protein E6H16_00925 [Candidatus Bathyarchaeota archaeon]|nr:MAG: hypothetical protein E6H23_08535 [Candidatus Bathyarchaeota archaeon]TMI69021.1 MAG: hypothetical protein E6H16_00925 [Candidatus Bathyarchaeota archaeon]